MVKVKRLEWKKIFENLNQRYNWIWRLQRIEAEVEDLKLSVQSQETSQGKEAIKEGSYL